MKDFLKAGITALAGLTIFLVACTKESNYPNPIPKPPTEYIYTGLEWQVTDGNAMEIEFFLSAADYLAYQHGSELNVYVKDEPREDWTEAFYMGAPDWRPLPSEFGFVVETNRIMVFKNEAAYRPELDGQDLADARMVIGN